MTGQEPSPDEVGADTNLDGLRLATGFAPRWTSTANAADLVGGRRAGLRDRVLSLAQAVSPRCLRESHSTGFGLGTFDEVPRDARRLMREARATVRAPLDEVVEEPRDGEPRAELIAACHEHAPAIVVVASRGVGGFRGLLLGSTARALADHAPCPVLVTREAAGPGGGRKVDA